MTVQVTEQVNSVATESQDSQATEQTKNGSDSVVTETVEAKTEEANTTEQEAGNEKKSALGIIQHAESLLKEGKELPADLAWTLPHIDADNLKTETTVEPTKEDDFEKMYNARRDKEDYEASIANLESEYDDETSKPLKEKIENLVSNHNMGHMQAFELVTGGLEPSKKAKLSAQRRSQTLPNRNDVSEEPNLEGYEETASAYKAKTGRTITKNAYKLGKEAGLY